jgi:hypothetical protein
MKYINGYSNLFFGWGGEDDDFSARIDAKIGKFDRLPLDIGRYYMIPHKRDQALNNNRYELIKGSNQRMNKDGLNTIQYKVVKKEYKQLYTHISVDYNQNKIIGNNKLKFIKNNLENKPEIKPIANQTFLQYSNRIN